MGKKDYRAGEAIEVTYQAAGATTGLTDVIMEIYDETGAKDVGNFPDVTMTEIGSTGRYKGSFTPYAQGKWRVMINSVTKPGIYVKDYGVGAYDVNSVGTAVAGLNNISTADVGAQVDVSLVDYGVTTTSDLGIVEENIRGADGDTLKDISEQIDAIPGFEQPPLIG